MELKDRLKKARKYAGLTQKEIESRINGLKQSSYSELERGESKSSTKLIDLAALFKVDPVWLATGEGEMLTKPTPSELMQRIRDIENGGARDSKIAPKGTVNVPMADNSDEVPILSWVAAGSWSNVEAVTFDDAIGRVSRPKNLSKNGFALIVRGQSMMPEFKPEDIIYVEPMVGLFSLKDSDLVVVQCNDDTEATFKQLVLGEKLSDMYLRPLNPDWHEQKMMPMGDCNLVGKVVGKYVEY